MLWLLFISLALGQDEPEPEPTVVYKQKTEIDFEGLEIEGQLLKPHGAIVQERKGATFNPLIQLRTDFNQEMKLSVSEIK